MIGFGGFVRQAARRGTLVVQPRMGFSAPERMRAGLLATRRAPATTVGTITVDSYTRIGHLDRAHAALRDGEPLNGYPIATHPTEVTREVLAGIAGPDFPVQVRHGSAVPRDIVLASIAAGLHATEGGPVSYCLPYGRTPLHQSVHNWATVCEKLAELRDVGIEPHLETFGGCMLGQLCPPSQLVALSVCEALFFAQHGLCDISVSYAQQTNHEQDREAVLALRRLCAELLPHVNWHVVIYAYMGMYPATDGGARRLLGRAAELAVETGAERLIVKTVAESRRIPTIEENVAALAHAGEVAALTRPPTRAPAADSQIYAEARALVEAVLDGASDLGEALLLAFKQGHLDIPYCVHPDNQGRTRSFIDDTGRLRWADTGSLPLAGLVTTGSSRPVTSSDLLAALSYVQRTYDDEEDHEVLTSAARGRDLAGGPAGLGRRTGGAGVGR
ncbi:methylaspartate mutase [Spongiactinospora rosea]|uniref:Methylaspartate mutase n=1 Tax=Spongiactinospora rosea TaxID=2248750 RepID=A0A366M5W4_9ACTN|nr:methylaspartate mutase [Spongiactinospora rosea]RBQ20842.1 methylaspartate mutase [Spongiactinospora rosea]